MNLHPLRLQLRRTIQCAIVRVFYNNFLHPHRASSRRTTATQYIFDNLIMAFRRRVGTIYISTITMVRTKIIYCMTPFLLFFLIVKFSGVFIIVVYIDGYILIPTVIRSDNIDGRVPKLFDERFLVPV